MAGLFDCCLFWSGFCTIGRVLAIYIPHLRQLSLGISRRGCYSRRCRPVLGALDVAIISQKFRIHVGLAVR